MHTFIEPPDPAWGDFCWEWNEDEQARCGWTREDHSDPIDVWLRIPDGSEESEAEANTYMTELGYRVEWYLTAVGLVTRVEFDTLADAYDWLESEGFANYTS